MGSARPEGAAAAPPGEIAGPAAHPGAAGPPRTGGGRLAQNFLELRSVFHDVHSYNGAAFNGALHIMVRDI